MLHCPYTQDARDAIDVPNDCADLAELFRVISLKAICLLCKAVLNCKDHWILLAPFELKFALRFRLNDLCDVILLEFCLNEFVHTYIGNLYGATSTLTYLRTCKSVQSEADWDCLGPLDNVLFMAIRALFSLALIMGVGPLIRWAPGARVLPQCP